MAEHIYSVPIPYRLDKRISLHAVGRWRNGAGVLQVFQDQRLLAQVDLPPSEWTLLAVLLKAALSSSGERWPHAFVDAKTLARELVGLAGLGDGEPPSLHRVIFRLRRSLSKKPLQQLSANKNFGKDLVERHARLGYRLSIGPEQIHVTPLDEPSTGPLFESAPDQGPREEQEGSQKRGKQPVR